MIRRQYTPPAEEIEAEAVKEEPVEKKEKPKTVKRSPAKKK